MNTPESNLQRHNREMRESIARLRAEEESNPQAKAIRAAMQLTKSEQAEIEASQAAVVEAERSVGAAMVALNRAQQAQEPPPRGFAFFEKSKGAHKAAAAAVSIPDLRVDLEEARNGLQAAIRRRNAVAARVDQARLQRRSEAKLKYAPKPVKPQSRGDRWMHKGLNGGTA